MRPGVDGDVVASSTGAAGSLPVGNHVTANVEQSCLLVGRVQEVVQPGTELGGAVVISEAPGSGRRKKFKGR